MAGSRGAVPGRHPQSQARQRRHGCCLRTTLPRSDAKSIDVLYHDLDERPGAKFATADLIGVPWQVLVGPRGLAEGKIELKRRSDGNRDLMTPADAIQRLSA